MILGELKVWIVGHVLILFLLSIRHQKMTFNKCNISMLFSSLTGRITYICHRSTYLGCLIGQKLELIVIVFIINIVTKICHHFDT